MADNLGSSEVRFLIFGIAITFLFYIRFYWACASDSLASKMLLPPLKQERILPQRDDRRTRKGTKTDYITKQGLNTKPNKQREQ